MSNSKYYQENLTQYSGGYGTLYYKPNGATASATVLDTDVHWMTTVNFSRTDRTKSVWARGTGTYSDLAIEIPIELERSPLMILLDDIDGQLIHGYTNSDVDIPNYVFEYTYTVRAGELGSLLDVTVLVNGNVISLDSDTIGKQYMIESVTDNYLYVSTNIDQVITNGIGVWDEHAYEDYPQNVGCGNVTVYKAPVTWGTNTKGTFDVITLSNPGDGTIGSITIPSNGGKLATSQLINYGEKQGLIAVRFQVKVNSEIPQDGGTTLFIATAVYKNGVLGQIDPNEPKAAAMRLHFVYDQSALEFSINGDDSINFSAAGAVGSDHEPSVTVSSNIPWVITDQDPQIGG